MAHPTISEIKALIQQPENLKIMEIVSARFQTVDQISFVHDIAFSSVTFSRAILHLLYWTVSDDRVAWTTAPLSVFFAAAKFLSSRTLEELVLEKYFLGCIQIECPMSEWLTTLEPTHFRYISFLLQQKLSVNNAAKFLVCIKNLLGSNSYPFDKSVFNFLQEKLNLAETAILEMIQSDTDGYFLVFSVAKSHTSPTTKG